MPVREMLKDFKPYEWEPSNEQIARQLGLSVGQIHRFDLNVSPYQPRRWLRRLASELERLCVNQYPDTSYSSLRTALAEYTGVDVDIIVVTNGADEAFDIISKTYVEKGCEVLTSAPTYSFYRIVPELLEGRVLGVPRRKDFSDDVNRILKSISEKTRLILLCSPNNPTGNTSKRRDVVRLLEESDCAVAVDESYYEFCGKTFIDLTSRYDNLIVVRTLSKAFSLAGARVGYIVASKQTARFLNKVRPPNSLSVISLALAEIALRDVEWVQEKVKETLKERDRCIDRLRRLKGVSVHPTEANFFLLRLDEADPERVYKELLTRGLVLRRLDTPLLEGCLRFCVGLPAQNDKFLSAMEEILG